MSITMEFIDQNLRRDPTLTSSENSVNILQTLSDAYAEQYPEEDIPEELRVPKVFTDDMVKFFAPYADGFSFSTVPVGTQTVVIETFANDQTWKDLVALKDSAAKDTIEVLYLGHDGLIYGEEADIIETLNSLPKLKEIHYCGYYSKYDDALIKASLSKGVQLIEIF